MEHALHPGNALTNDNRHLDSASPRLRCTQVPHLLPSPSHSCGNAKDRQDTEKLGLQHRATSKSPENSTVTWCEKRWRNGYQESAFLAFRIQIDGGANSTCTYQKHVLLFRGLIRTLMSDNISASTARNYAPAVSDSREGALLCLAHTSDTLTWTPRHDSRGNTAVPKPPLEVVSHKLRPIQMVSATLSS